jgi:hypothetical protein
MAVISFFSDQTADCSMIYCDIFCVLTDIMECRVGREMYVSTHETCDRNRTYCVTSSYYIYFKYYITCYWIELAQDRDRRQACVNALMNLRVL